MWTHVGSGTIWEENQMSPMTVGGLDIDGKCEPICINIASVHAFLFYLTESEGGVITTHHHAYYLFSSNAAHRDTQRIYNSLDYVENKTTVFHASFLKTSARSKANHLLALGHFILPPACLQEEIRRKIGSFIWEQDDTLQKNQVSIELKSLITESCNVLACREPSAFQRGMHRPRHAGRFPLRGGGSLLSTVVRGSDVTAAKEAPFILVNEGEMCWKVKEAGHMMKKDLTSDSGSSDDGIQHTLQNYPGNNIQTGYISIDQLKKFPGELHDFRPDSSEYLVFCVKAPSYKC
ncbi:PREDICTED: telomere repeats-binding bouquet formation protein 2 [Nanorana parkeri]|uniref:telomere repeats-binding bouquet formation protein 2 n=1 Tax=Nanorana parkeri TaxID=125878 RepID=UPI000854B1C9|nr:PREDICTED: telomere repeats-binding bouquet formation protein 2 [Nanorana parkeri]